MFNHLTIDIETVPVQDPKLIEAIVAEAFADAETEASNIQAPGNYKDPEKIAQFVAEKQASILSDAKKTAQEKVLRTSLNGDYGMVAVVGLVINEGPVKTIFHPEWQGAKHDERSILVGLNNQLEEMVQDPHGTSCVGHNHLSFDMPFLLKRFVIHSVTPHPMIKFAANAKPWSPGVNDTMTMWAGVGNRISLDRLCRILGVQTPKGAIDGSKVFEYIQAGKIAEVAAYCAHDVVATREVFKRMSFKQRLGFDKESESEPLPFVEFEDVGV